YYLLLPCLALLCGCENRVAEFAKRTNELLAEYQKRIDVQIDEASVYYRASAAAEAFEARRVDLGNLDAERKERATQLDVDFAGQRRFPGLYRTYLREYADGHFQKNAEWISADLDASAPYLQQLVALESDKATVDAFGKILKQLSEPRKLSDELGELKEFA